MQNPSLVVVPYRYKATKLYSEIPITGVGDFTVGRLLNTATRVNSNGNIEVVNANIPRLDYYTTGGVAGCPALLVEPSAENLALQSENFGTTWGLVQLLAFGSGSVLNTTATLDPYGTNLADFIVANTVSDQHRVDQTTVSVSGSYTFSIFLKAAGYNFGRLRLSGIGATFNLASGTISATDTGIVSSIQSYGNGWYRCIISKAASVANEIVRVNILQSGSGDFAGNGTSGIYIFGSQYESGTVATSYIPTTTGSVTRNADVINVSGAVSGCIGQTEGTIYAEVDLRNTSSGKRLFLLSDGTAQNEIRVTSSATNAGDLQFAVRLAGTLILNSFSPTNVYSNGIFKIAAVYKSTDYALYVNGLQVLTGNGAGNIPACNRVDIGSQLGTSNFLNDRIRAVALYTTRLDDADLMVLTSPTYYSNVRDMIWDTFVARTSTFSELPGCLQTRHNELITL
jgi:hypothetical protein